MNYTPYLYADNSLFNCAIMYIHVAYVDDLERVCRNSRSS